MDCLDLLLEILETEENVSIIAETDLVLDLLDELVEDKSVEFVEAMEELEETDILVLSSIGDEIIVEDHFNEDGDCILVENDLVIIQEGVLGEEEFDDYIFADEIFTLEIEEDEDSDDEDYTCDYYYAGFKDGYNQAICEAIDMLYDKLKIE